MLPRLSEQKLPAASVSIADRLPILLEPKYPLALPAPKLNGAAELKITRDGLDLKVAVSIDMGR